MDSSARITPRDLQLHIWNTTKRQASVAHLRTTTSGLVARILHSLIVVERRYHGREAMSGRALFNEVLAHERNESGAPDWKPDFPLMVELYCHCLRQERLDYGFWPELDETASLFFDAGEGSPPIVSLEDGTLAPLLQVMNVAAFRLLDVSPELSRADMNRLNTIRASGARQGSVAELNKQLTNAKAVTSTQREESMRFIQSLGERHYPAAKNILCDGGTPLNVHQAFEGTLKHVGLPTWLSHDLFRMDDANPLVLGVFGMHAWDPDTGTTVNVRRQLVDLRAAAAAAGDEAGGFEGRGALNWLPDMPPSSLVRAHVGPDFDDVIDWFWQRHLLRHRMDECQREIQILIQQVPSFETARAAAEAKTNARLWELAVGASDSRELAHQFVVDRVIQALLAEEVRLAAKLGRLDGLLRRMQWLRELQGKLPETPQGGRSTLPAEDFEHVETGIAAIIEDLKLYKSGGYVSSSPRLEPTARLRSDLQPELDGKTLRLPGYGGDKLQAQLGSHLGTQRLLESSVDDPSPRHGTMRIPGHGGHVLGDSRAHILQNALCSPPEQNSLTLAYVLKRAHELARNDLLFLAGTWESWTETTPALVVSLDELDDEDRRPDTTGMAYVLGISDLQDVMGNALDQDPQATISTLLNALRYFTKR
jgi:hypothetical protein